MELVYLIVVGLLFSAYVVSFRMYERKIRLLKTELAELQSSTKRRDTTSRSVIKGQIAEQIYPLLPNCPFVLADMKFFGQPFDYLVLKGYSEGDISEVVFVEVKTGSSRLSPVQRSLRRCIEQRRVSWETAELGSLSGEQPHGSN
jgi:predicted Holliday junction resolvase-like endonuclease